MLADQAELLDEALGRASRGLLPYAPEYLPTIRQHLAELLSDIQSLTLRVDSYTHPDGTTADLLVAEGTLPMWYRGVQYHLPIAAWLPESYPLGPPILYVVPTPSMVVRPRHPTVAASGLVNTAYLRSWEFPDSTLREAAIDAAISFGQDPPLFSKPPGWDDDQAQGKPGQPPGQAAGRPGRPPQAVSPPPQPVSTPGYSKPLKPHQQQQPETRYQQPVPTPGYSTKPSSKPQPAAAQSTSASFESHNALYQRYQQQHDRPAADAALTQPQPQPQPQGRPASAGTYDPQRYPAPQYAAQTSPGSQQLSQQGATAFVNPYGPYVTSEQAPSGASASLPSYLQPYGSQTSGAPSPSASAAGPSRPQQQHQQQQQQQQSSYGLDATNPLSSMGSTSRRRPNQSQPHAQAQAPMQSPMQAQTALQASGAGPPAAAYRPPFGGAASGAVAAASGSVPAVASGYPSTQAYAPAASGAFSNPLVAATASSTPSQAAAGRPGQGYGASGPQQPLEETFSGMRLSGSSYGQAPQPQATGYAPQQQQGQQPYRPESYASTAPQPQQPQQPPLAQGGYASQQAQHQQQAPQSAYPVQYPQQQRPLQQQQQPQQQQQQQRPLQQQQPQQQQQPSSGYGASPQVAQPSSNYGYAAQPLQPSYGSYGQAPSRPLQASAQGYAGDASGLPASPSGHAHGPRPPSGGVAVASPPQQTLQPAGSAGSIGSAASNPPSHGGYGGYGGAAPSPLSQPHLQQQQQQQPAPAPAPSAVPEPSAGLSQPHAAAAYGASPQIARPTSAYVGNPASSGGYGAAYRPQGPQPGAGSSVGQPSPAYLQGLLERLPTPPTGAPGFALDPPEMLGGVDVGGGMLARPAATQPHATPPTTGPGQGQAPMYAPGPGSVGSGSGSGYPPYAQSQPQSGPSILSTNQLPAPPTYRPPSARFSGSSLPQQPQYGSSSGVPLPLASSPAPPAPPPPPPPPPPPSRAPSAQAIEVAKSLDGALRAAAIGELTWRLHRSLAGPLAAARAQVDACLATRGELLSRADVARSETRALRTAREAVDRDAVAYAAAAEQLEAWLARAGSRAAAPPASPDEAIEVPDPDDRAALLAHARDAALEDAMAALDRFLGDGVVPAALYLRLTRQLSRQQLRARVLGEVAEERRAASRAAEGARNAANGGGGGAGAGNGAEAAYAPGLYGTSTGYPSSANDASAARDAQRRKSTLSRSAAMRSTSDGGAGAGAGLGGNGNRSSSATSASQRPGQRPSPSPFGDDADAPGSSPGSTRQVPSSAAASNPFGDDGGGDASLGGFGSSFGADARRGGGGGSSSTSPARKPSTRGGAGAGAGGRPSSAVAGGGHEAYPSVVLPPRGSGGPLAEAARRNSVASRAADANLSWIQDDADGGRREPSGEMSTNPLIKDL